MSASRHRPKNGKRRSFGLVIFFLAMMPTPVGFQDLAALIARQPAVSDRWRQYVRVTPFGTVQAATFSFPQPLGTLIPMTPGYTLASLDPRALDITGSIGDPRGNPLTEPVAPPIEFPAVNRTLKGDLLVPRERPAPAEDPRKDKPKKAPEKTQDRAQFEEPQPIDKQAEVLPAQPAPQAADASAVQPEIVAEPKIAATLEPAPVPAQTPVAEAPAAQAPVAQAPAADAEPAPQVIVQERTQSDWPSGMDLEFTPGLIVRQAEAELPTGMDLEFSLRPQARDAVAELPSGMDLEFKLRPQVRESVAELPSGMDMEFKLRPQAREAVAALPSGMDLEFKLRPQVRESVVELPSGMDLEFKLRPQPREAVAALPSGMDLEFSLYPKTQQAEAEILTDEEPVDSDVVVRSAIKPDNPAERIARLFFGADTLGPNEGKLQPWREGEAPVLMPMHPSVDPDIKRAAIAPAQKDAALKPDAKSEGETVAPKGEVTGEGKRPMTPAERLGLNGASRVKHERCLTNAIYFEARGEFERGQMAVAQVILNRAFSGYYPDNVCGVVYQNSHRHLACQFTFACDNVRDVVTEPDAWEVAKRISRDSLDGKIWLPEIGKATHYHATYVSPWWVRTMTKHKTLGIHIFYRPTRWGDGAEAPAWGPAASVERSVAKARM